MTKLRTILAENLKAYRTEMGLSQLKLAELVDTAPNYIAMIEAEKRFPTDTMLEKIAVSLQREPCELFAISPIQKKWQELILAEMAEFIARKLKNIQRLFQNFSFGTASFKNLSFVGRRPKNCKSLFQNRARERTVN